MAGTSSSSRARPLRESFLRDILFGEISSYHESRKRKQLELTKLRWAEISNSSSHRNLLDLTSTSSTVVDTLSEEDLDRLEVLKRSRLRKDRVKHIMHEALPISRDIDDETATIVAAVAKEYIHELCETGTYFAVVLCLILAFLSMPFVSYSAVHQRQTRQQQQHSSARRLRPQTFGL